MMLISISTVQYDSSSNKLYNKQTRRQQQQQHSILFLQLTYSIYSFYSYYLLLLLLLSSDHTDAQVQTYEQHIFPLHTICTIRLRMWTEWKRTSLQAAHSGSSLFVQVSSRWCSHHQSEQRYF